MDASRHLRASGRAALLAACCALALGALPAPAHGASFARWSSYVPPPVKACPAAANATREPIGMWGCAGEAWRAGGPLSDWSFAGYGAGLEAIPDAPVAVDVRRDFEAAGDGVTDDTAAVLAALKATQAGGGVIFFPPGRYLLHNQLNISSNQVLRGAGRDATTLLFNTSLQQLYGWGPRWRAGQEASPYTWSGALISTQREKRMFNPSTLELGKVTRPAARGDRRLYVGNFTGSARAAAAAFKAGQWVSLGMFETPEADMARAFCNNRTDVGDRLGPDFGNRQMFSHMSRVTAVGPDWIELERPLHVDVALAFKPTLYRSFNFKVTGVGVEDLTVEFPWTPYLGHHEEPGYNAIEFEAATNSWVRRVRIINADSGIKLYSSIFNTVSDIEVGTSPKPRRGGRWYGRDEVMQDTDKDGHMAIALHWACFDNLVERFNITPIFYHELLVAGYSAHNVFSNGTGTDVCLDHHGGAPHNNLWTDIDLGSGQAAMRWSGAPQHFPFAGSNNVFWNVWASKIPASFDYAAGLEPSSRRTDNMRAPQRASRLPVMSRPASIQGYGQVVVDMPLDSQIPPIKEAGDWFIYYRPNQRVWPANLHAAMDATQAARLTPAPPLNGAPALMSALTGQLVYRPPVAAAPPKPAPVANATKAPAAPANATGARVVARAPAANATRAPAAAAAPARAPNATASLAPGALRSSNTSAAQPAVRASGTSPAPAPPAARTGVVQAQPAPKVPAQPAQRSAVASPAPAAAAKAAASAAASPGAAGTVQQPPAQRPAMQQPPAGTAPTVTVALPAVRLELPGVQVSLAAQRVTLPAEQPPQPAALALRPPPTLAALPLPGLPLPAPGLPLPALPLPAPGLALPALQQAHQQLLQAQQDMLAAIGLAQPPSMLPGLVDARRLVTG
ncbi:hypothetical protein HT031_004500 [Scenedesmus sp. PABB004]|nr:hypothetical protein HT031_004500 [Scenedesmus sp. PABB004]